MRIDLSFVELHSALFLDGTNYGTKLYSDAKKNLKGPIEIWYETDLEHTFIVANGQVAMVESTASKTVADLSQLKDYVKLNVKTPGIMGGHAHADATLKSIPVQPVQAQVFDPTKPKAGKKGLGHGGPEVQGE